MTKRTIEGCKALARERNGKCLSDKYVNNRTKMLWECEFGHRWYAVWANVYNNGSWCPWCIGRVVTIDDAIKIAKENGGECLSTEYVNSASKMKWKCSVGHVFSKSYGSVKNSKQWCKFCNGFYNINIVKEVDSVCQINMLVINLNYSSSANLVIFGIQHLGRY